MPHTLEFCCGEIGAETIRMEVYQRMVAFGIAFTFWLLAFQLIYSF